MERLLHRRDESPSGRASDVYGHWPNASLVAYGANSFGTSLASGILFLVSAFAAGSLIPQISGVVFAALSFFGMFSVREIKRLHEEKLRRMEERDQLRREQELERLAVQRYAAAEGKTAEGKTVASSPAYASKYDISLEDLESDTPKKPQKHHKAVPYPLQTTLYVLCFLLCAAAIILWGPSAYHAFFGWMDSILAALG